jgi:TolB-like protein
VPLSSVGEDQEQLAFGLADALISRLGRLRDIVVRPTSSVVRFAAANMTPAETGRAARADLVLCGSLRRHGRTIRSSVQLVDVESEASVWAGQFDEASSDVFAMEDAIAARVTPLLVNELAQDATEEERASDWGRRRVRVEQCADVLQAEDVYGQLVCERATFGPSTTLLVSGLYS